MSVDFGAEVAKIFETSARLYKEAEEALPALKEKYKEGSLFEKNLIEGLKNIIANGVAATAAQKILNIVADELESSTVNLSDVV